LGIILRERQRQSSSLTLLIASKRYTMPKQDATHVERQHSLSRMTLESLYSDALARRCSRTSSYLRDRSSTMRDRSSTMRDRSSTTMRDPAGMHPTDRCSRLATILDAAIEIANGTLEIMDNTERSSDESLEDTERSSDDWTQQGQE
jgi:hypothetical protein